MSKEKKNICGKTEAPPELIVPGGLIRKSKTAINLGTKTSLWGYQESMMGRICKKTHEPGVNNRRIDGEMMSY